jgi:hypothetical protein
MTIDAMHHDRVRSLLGMVPMSDMRNAVASTSGRSSGTAGTISEVAAMQARLIARSLQASYNASMRQRDARGRFMAGPNGGATANVIALESRRANQAQVRQVEILEDMRKQGKAQIEVLNDILKEQIKTGKLLAKHVSSSVTSTVTGVLGKLFGKLWGGLSKLGGGAIGLLGMGAGAVGTMGRAAIARLMGAGRGVIGSIPALPSSVARAGSAVMRGMGAMAATLSTFLASSAGSMLAKFGPKLMAGARFLPGIGALITGLAAAYQGLSGWNRAAELLGRDLDPKEWRGRIAGAVGGIIGSIPFFDEQKVAKWVDDALGSAGGIMTKAKDKFMEFIQAPVDALFQLGGAVKTYVAEGLESARAKVSEFISGDFANIAISIRDWMGGVVSRITEGFKSFFSSINPFKGWFGGDSNDVAPAPALSKLRGPGSLPQMNEVAAAASSSGVSGATTFLSPATLSRSHAGAYDAVESGAEDGTYRGLKRFFGEGRSSMNRTPELADPFAAGASGAFSGGGMGGGGGLPSSPGTGGGPGGPGGGMQGQAPSGWKLPFDPRGLAGRAKALAGALASGDKGAIMRELSRGELRYKSESGSTNGNIWGGSSSPVPGGSGGGSGGLRVSPPGYGGGRSGPGGGGQSGGGYNPGAEPGGMGGVGPTGPAGAPTGLGGVGQVRINPSTGEMTVGGSLSQVTARSGAKFSVASDHQDRFAGFLQELEDNGVNIDGRQSGGYNHRTIAGTNRLSNHAHGSAIDINWSRNGVGSGAGELGNQLGSDKVREIAKKYGLKWGGDFKSNNDPMHFEVDKSIKDVAPFIPRDGAGGAGGGQPGGQQGPGGAPAMGGSAGPIQMDGARKINPASFAAVMESKVRGSELDGKVPEWGPQFGINKGTPQEWSRFFTMVQQQESGHRLAETNPDGSLQRFATTPAGEKSFGPGQFNKGEYGLKTWADVNDPNKVADAYIDVAKKGKVPAYFGSVQRPNETLQHSKWFDKEVAPNLPAARAAAAAAASSSSAAMAPDLRQPGKPGAGAVMSPSKSGTGAVLDLSGLPPEKRSEVLQQAFDKGLRNMTYLHDGPDKQRVVAKPGDPKWGPGNTGDKPFAGPAWANDFLVKNKYPNAVAMDPADKAQALKDSGINFGQGNGNGAPRPPPLPMSERGITSFMPRQRATVNPTFAPDIGPNGGISTGGVVSMPVNPTGNVTPSMPDAMAGGGDINQAAPPPPPEPIPPPPPEPPRSEKGAGLDFGVNDIRNTDTSELLLVNQSLMI